MDWYQQCTLELKSISSCMSVPSELSNMKSVAVNEHVWGKILLLVVAGFDILERTEIDGNKWDDKDKKKILKRAKNVDNQRLPTTSLLSIGNSLQCRELLHSVAIFDQGKRNGVYFRCHLILWQSVARKFLLRLRKKGRKTQDRPCLDDARRLVSQLQSYGNTKVDFKELAAEDVLIHSIYYFDILPLQKYIHDIEILQKDTKQALERCRRSGKEKKGMNDLLEEFKSLRSRFRLQHESGLGDDCNHGKDIDRRIKDITFLLSAYEYEAVLISKCKPEKQDNFGYKRIPLDDLLSISDRIPSKLKNYSDVKNHSGFDIDLSLIRGRVMELCNDANSWEEDVRKCIPVPMSCVSRATTRLSSASKKDPVDEFNPRQNKLIKREDLKKLSEDPFLDLVSILMNIYSICFFLVKIFLIFECIMSIGMYAKRGLGSKDIYPIKGIGRGDHRYF